MFKEDNYTLTIEVPGIRPEDIEVTAESYSTAHRVKVRAKRNNTHYSDSYLIPSRFDVDKLTASVDLGVLTLTLPLKSEARPRQIPVTTTAPLSLSA